MNMIKIWASAASGTLPFRAHLTSFGKTYFIRKNLLHSEKPTSFGKTFRRLRESKLFYELVLCGSGTLPSRAQAHCKSHRILDAPNCMTVKMLSAI